MQIKLRYLKCYTDNRGTLRAYFRRKGHVVALPGDAGSREFMAAYAALLHAGSPPAAGGDKGCSINALVASYYNTTDWQKLRAPSQKKYRRWYEWLRGEYGAGMVAKVERRHVMAWIECHKANLAAADQFRTRLVVLFKHAVALDIRDDNPAAAVPPIKRDQESHRCWSEAEIAAFEKAYPVGTTPRLVFTLALEIGARKSDVVRLTRDNFANGRCEFVQFKTRGKGKTGGRVSKPIDAKIRAVLAALPAAKVVAIGAKSSGPLVTTARGMPVCETEFSRVFGVWRKEAGLPDGLTLHGLRHARGRRLAERGCTAHEIMADMGWQTLAEAQRYCDQYNRTEAADAAAEKMR